MPRAKNKTQFVCESCGNDTPKWTGQCSSCAEWNTLVEMRVDALETHTRAWDVASINDAEELSEVSVDQVPRLETGSSEVNRVLGGGVVPGSLVLVSGDPGIGKSTLLLKLASDVARVAGGVLYVSGEESAAQIKIRAERMGLSGQGVFLLEATDLDRVIMEAEARKPKLVVVDSIQTIYNARLEAAPASVSQIKECTRLLMGWAKSEGVPILLSGHVTKGGDVAGPKVMEHMVDAVLYMEGDPISSWRLLRSVKNRFGSTNEVGVFEMSSSGLTDVEDPSQAFIAERRDDSFGSVIVSIIEGSRPLLTEVQALTNPSIFGTPRRVANGVDFNRILVVCAVLSRQVGLPLATQDVVINIVGGMRVDEPASDLAVALAIASSVQDVPVRHHMAAIGEIGLTGEIRRVPQLDRRVQEAARLGLKFCVVPSVGSESVVPPKGMELLPVETLRQAIRASIGVSNVLRTSDAVES
jgi:DNA repair protein RadA/Sms